MSRKKLRRLPEFTSVVSESDLCAFFSPFITVNQHRGSHSAARHGTSAIMNLTPGLVMINVCRTSKGRFKLLDDTTPVYAYLAHDKLSCAADTQSVLQLTTKIARHHTL